MRRLGWVWLAGLAACSEHATDFAGTYSGGEGGEAVEPGALTAGAWDDNDNFDLFEAYTADKAELEGAAPFTAPEREAARDRSETAPGARRRLDVALVLDTTGSMGDELSYLTLELDALTADIERAWPDAEQRWAVVLYRDHGDAYVTDVTPLGPPERARDALSQARAGGGGDYPEAPVEALRDAVDLDWRTGDDARLVFWLADAPYHDGAGAAFASVVRDAVDQDVRIYPIAASGSDPLTELSMRSAAQLTLGRYLFLTDDSGIGEDHAEPEIPCYAVTRLTDAVRRMVDIELSGVYREAGEDEVLRRVGDWDQGRCALDDGGTAIGF